GRRLWKRAALTRAASKPIHEIASRQFRESDAGRAQGIAAESPQARRKAGRGLAAESPVFLGGRSTPKKMRLKTAAFL
ncbi:MAG: hypothetical protein LBK13_07205, partial [Spirochaetales bacterium]|nr:hypothetical protein [Spirochaetales bacterium]